MTYVRWLFIGFLWLLAAVACTEDMSPSSMPNDPHLRAIWEVAAEGGFLTELNLAIQESEESRLKKDWNKRVSAVQNGYVKTASDIKTDPLTPDTGTYAETPISRPPKDPALKKIYENAEKGGYLRDLERAIEKNGGPSLKKKWNEK